MKLPVRADLSAMSPSGIRRFTALAAQTPGCVSLALGEPDGATPQPICDAAAAALARGRTHYAPNQGTLSLRQAIAAYETARGFPCGPENLLITLGATGALNTALGTILNPGDQVIIPTPAFPLYESIVRSLGAEPVFLDLSNTGFQITPEALTSVLTPATRAIVLNSPCNPTGAVLSEASLAVVKQAVLGKPLWILCDNVYAPLCAAPVPDLTLDPELCGQVLLCQSFSKPWAMTGWRIGYLAGPEWLMERSTLLQAAQLASVPTFLQDAAETALTVDISPTGALYACRRDYAAGRLRAMGLSFPAPEGGFYLFPDISQFGLTDEAFCLQAIREAGVAFVPGSCFRGPGRIRISCCVSGNVLETGLDRLEAFLRSLDQRAIGR